MDKHVKTDRALLMLDSITIAIAFFNENLQCIDCNRLAVDMFGFGEKERYIGSLYRSMPPFQPNGTPSRQMFDALLSEAFEKGKSRSAITCQRANGALLPVDATFIRDEYERSSVVIVSFHDLTEIKAAIREATSAAEMANMYLSASPLAMELFNDECAIIDCNQQALDLLDFPDKTEYMKRITYKAPEYLYHGIYSRGNDEEYYRTALRDGYVRYEWVFRKKNGTRIPCEITRVRIIRPDRIFVVSYIHDLSAVKAMAEELKKAGATEKENRAK